MMQVITYHEGTHDAHLWLCEEHGFSKQTYVSGVVAEVAAREHAERRHKLSRTLNRSQRISRGLPAGTNVHA